MLPLAHVTNWPSSSWDIAENYQNLIGLIFWPYPIYKSPFSFLESTSELNQVHSTIFTWDIIDLKILQCDFLRAFLTWSTFAFLQSFSECKKSHTCEEGWEAGGGEVGGDTPEFLFGIYWWTWKATISLKNCQSGPIKNVSVLIFTKIKNKK